MSVKVLRRFRQCAGCDLAASENSDLCRQCQHDDEWRVMFEAPVENFEACRDCGGELSRNGHCFACLDATWSPAQVAAR